MMLARPFLRVHCSHAVGGQQAKNDTYVFKAPEPATHDNLLHMGMQQAHLGSLHASVTRSRSEQLKVGVASVALGDSRCNSRLGALAAEIERGVRFSDMASTAFTTVGSNVGTGTRPNASAVGLQYRDLAADSVETMMGAASHDGTISLTGCDTNMSGSLIALCRINRPSLMIYGGASTTAGRAESVQDASSFFSAATNFQQNGGSPFTPSTTWLNATDSNYSCGSCGSHGPSCAGTLSAITLACAVEALGFTLPYSSTTPSDDALKAEECLRAGKALRRLVDHNVRPLDILTRAAFENAMTVCAALGGSTDVVLSLIAVARACGIRLHLSDFQRVSDRTPVLVGLQPFGRVSVADFHRAGGTPALMKLLFEAGRIDGSCMTVTGYTIEDNLSVMEPVSCGQHVICPLPTPVSKRGFLKIFGGGLAPDGAVANVTASRARVFEGKALVFDSAEILLTTLEMSPEVFRDAAIVIRYEGPKGGPGMPDLTQISAALDKAGLGKTCALLTDGRCAGAIMGGFVISHISPEAQVGGPIAYVKSGDTIRIDATTRTIEVVGVSAEEWENRRAHWVAPPLRAHSGSLYKYIRSVSSASMGCVTDVAEADDAWCTR